MIALSTDLIFSVKVQAQLYQVPENDEEKETNRESSIESSSDNALVEGTTPESKFPK